MVELVFNLLDTDGDGEISVTEFIKGCLEDKELLSVLQWFILVQNKYKI